ncbi:MAG: hypothetical protein ACTHLE_04385 [Agriterribacter sp.]
MTPDQLYTWQMVQYPYLIATTNNPEAKRFLKDQLNNIRHAYSNQSRIEHIDCGNHNSSSIVVSQVQKIAYSRKIGGPL